MSSEELEERGFQKHFQKIIQLLQNDFLTRLDNFHSSSSDIFFQNPFKVDINDTVDEFQMEVTELQTNNTLKMSSGRQT